MFYSDGFESSPYPEYVVVDNGFSHSNSIDQEGTIRGKCVIRNYRGETITKMQSGVSVLHLEKGQMDLEIGIEDVQIKGEWMTAFWATKANRTYPRGQ